MINLGDMLNKMKSDIDFNTPHQDETHSKNRDELQEKIENLAKDFERHNIPFTLLMFPTVKTALTQAFFTTYISQTNEYLPLTFQVMHQIFGTVLDHFKNPGNKTVEELNFLMDFFFEVDRPKFSTESPKDMEVLDEFNLIFADRFDKLTDEIRAAGFNFIAIIPFRQKTLVDDRIEFGLRKNICLNDGYEKNEKHINPMFLPVNANKALTYLMLSRAIMTYLELENDSRPMSLLHLGILKGASEGLKNRILYNKE